MCPLIYLRLLILATTRKSCGSLLEPDVGVEMKGRTRCWNRGSCTGRNPHSVTFPLSEVSAHPVLPLPTFIILLEFACAGLPTDLCIDSLLSS